MKRVAVILGMALAFCSCKKENNDAPKSVRFSNIENADYIAYKSSSQLKSDELGGSLYALTITGNVLESNEIQFIDENGNEISQEYVTVEIESSYEIENYIWFSGNFKFKTSAGEIVMKSFMVNKSTGEIFDTQGDFPSFDRNFDVQTDAAGNYYFATTNNGYLYTLKKLSFADGNISITDFVNEYDFMTTYFCITPQGDCIYSAEDASLPNKVMLADGTKTSTDGSHGLFFSDGKNVYADGGSLVGELVDGKYVFKAVEQHPEQTEVTFRKVFIPECPDLHENSFGILGTIFECGPNMSSLLTLPDNIDNSDLYYVGKYKSTVWVANEANTKVYAFSLDEYTGEIASERYILNLKATLNVPKLSSCYVSVVDDESISYGGISSEGHVSGVISTNGVLSTNLVAFDRVIKL